jgi:toxin YoeB
MRLTWLPNDWKDYLYWQKTDRKTPQQVNEVISDALRNPFIGIGTPEPLKNNLKGWGSRRITREHRLIYWVEGESFLIMQCRFYYDD